MPSRDRIPSELTEGLPRPTTEADEPLDEADESWATIREIGVLQVALSDLLSDAANLKFRLQDASPAMNLSPAAIAKVLDLAIPQAIRDSSGNAVLYAGLTAWFDDLGAQIVRHRTPRLENARAFRKAREERERIQAEREEAVSRHKAEEAIKWRTHASEHDQYLAWKASQNR
jgi:hypothetical protein